MASRLFFVFAICAFQCRPVPEVSQQKAADTPKTGLAAAKQKAREVIAVEQNLLSQERRAFIFNKEFQRVQQTRALQAQGPVSARQLSSEDLLGYVQQLIERDVDTPQYVQETILLKALELLPATLDRKAAELELLGRELNGLYDPKAKTLVIRQGLSSAMSKLTIYHELTHALQDQHYGLEEALKYKPGANDARSALHSLAEGDALLTMVKAVFDESRADFYVAALKPLETIYAAGTAIQNERVPKLLSLAALAPYRDGLQFAKYLYEKGGVAALSNAWLRPPTTTEQLLHPSEYEKNSQPRTMTHHAAPPGYALVYEDTVGEQALRIMGEVWTNPATAQQAATGWDGDRVSLFISPIATDDAKDKTVGHSAFLVWDIATDSLIDAEEVRLLLETGLNSLERGSIVTPKDPCKQTHLLGHHYLVTEKESSTQLTLGPLRVDPNSGIIYKQLRDETSQCSQVQAFVKALR